MKLLDRYVLGILTASFAICLCGVLALYVLIDGLDRFDSFSDYSQNAGVPLVSVFASYYAVRLPLFFVQVGPAIMLMASMFAMTRMVRFNELVPILASGASAYFAMRVHAVFALGVALAMMAISEFVLPPLAHEIERGKVFDEGDAGQVDHRQLYDGYGRVFYCGQVRQFERAILIVRVVERDPRTGRRATEYVADRATWEDVPGGMVLVLRDGEVRRFASSSADPLAQVPGYPMRFAGERETLRIATDLVPAALVRAQKIDVEFATSARELYRQVREDPKRHVQALSLHLRFALPLATLVLLALGLPLIVGTETGNLFMGAGLCVVIVSGFYLSLLVAINLGNKAVLQPGFAAWAPLALFGSLGWTMLRGVRT